MRQRMYRGKYSIALAPFVGFIYLIFNPRFTWFKGTLELVSHVARKKVERPDLSMKVHAASFETRYWQSRKEYWHMFWNNVVLLGVWALMCWAIGAARFFSIYLISLSFAGGVGILLFTVQHNFRHSYASDTQNWDYDAGAIEGTSFLILPRWLNSFTANIGYHHIHHLSARIPNYRLISCHNQNQSSRRAWWLPDPSLARRSRLSLFWSVSQRPDLSMPERPTRTLGRVHFPIEKGRPIRSLTPTVWHPEEDSKKSFCFSARASKAIIKFIAETRNSKRYSLRAGYSQNPNHLPSSAGPTASLMGI
jgi:hypothetical protein